MSRCIFGTLILSLIFLSLPAFRATAEESNPVVAGKKVSEWRSALLAAPDRERAKLIEILEKSGTLPATLLPVCLELLPADSKDWPRSRGNLASLMSRICKDSPRCLDALLAELDKGTEDRRIVILMAMQYMKEAARSAAPKLLDLAVNTEQPRQFRCYVIDTLKQIKCEAAVGLPRLLPLLRNSDEQLCSRVLEVIGFWGAAANAALPDLQKLLQNQNQDKYLRAEAALAIGRMGQKGKEALPTMISFLREIDTPQTAAEALGLLGPDAAPAVPVLMQKLRDRNQVVVGAAAKALSRIGIAARPAIPEMIQIIKEAKTLDERRCLAAALGNFGADAPESLPVLIEWMRQDKWQYDNYSPIELAVLKVAIAAWWEGTGDRSEIEKLLPKLGLLQDSRVRNLVLWVFCQTKEELDQIQMRYARALPRFVVRFVSEKDRDYIFKELEKLSDSEVRANTADARQEWLTKTFQPLPPIKLLPPIKASAADSSEPSYQGHSLSEWTAALKNESSRVAALSALLHCGPEGVRALLRADYGNACPRLDLSGLKEKELEAIVPVLIEALKDKNKLVRRPAPEWIVQLPPVLRKPAIPALIDALNDVDLPTRTWVATALGQIGPDAKDAVPKLVLAMHDQDRDLRRAAMSALGGIGPAAKDAVPLLIDRFQREKDRFERCHIPLILGQIGPVTPEVLPILLTALKDPEFNTRNFAAMALGNMKSKEAASALVGVLKTLNEDQNVLKSAAESLGKLGPNKAAVAVLAKRARDPNEDWQVRGAAMSAMTRVDADLITALAVLRENLADPNALVLIRTAETIGELGGRAQPLIPALGKMLMDARGKREGFVTARLLAVQAFEKIGADEECIKVLETTAKDDPDPMITRVAKETLQKLRK